jgi:D-glycero-D-manno-heptose 1,7-bisphosphate phosphatase
LLRALEQLDVPPAEAWMVGDADRDIVAGRRAGCRTAMIEHAGSAHRRDGEQADACAATLLEFVSTLLRTVAAT